ncbi:site-specific integrase [Cupriavidus alkaliphilus]|uniref:site-specific integrase n=1 Tax=Cupriavidus alkaliphilus TaxID=942866 RepID=UPI000DC57895|nr:site-specific integrase [Cupriavidus alkaliphilus]RAS11981.1 phage integrase family protein [Cupriavidus alkaliphilus]
MHLRHRDINMTAGTTHLPDSTNGDPRVLPLTKPVLDKIRRFGRPASPDYLLFGRPAYPDRPFHFQNPWLKALADAHIEEFRFHDLRHTCASYLAQNGGGLHDIANVLGHRQLDVTRRYAHERRRKKTTPRRSAAPQAVSNAERPCRSVPLLA